MDQDTIVLAVCEEHHLDGALQLSQEAGWPHRRDDWAMMLALSRGFVALEGGRVVGTALMTPFEDRSATINMVIVSAAMRGRGLGRKLMDAALQACGERECGLVATKDGLPLYERLGFRATHEIRQHQGDFDAEAPLANGQVDIDWIGSRDFERVLTLDKQAFGFDRQALLRFIAKLGRIAVLRESDDIVGYGALRRFGRGEVIGPVIAATQADAQSLISFLIAARSGSFLRVDTPVSAELSPWLTALGLKHAGGGVAMRRGAFGAAAAGLAKPFALASQALG